MQKYFSEKYKKILKELYKMLKKKNESGKLNIFKDKSADIKKNN